MSDALFDFRALEQFANLIEHQFGRHCEVVLHDLSKPYDHTIIDIRNGHLTGRTIGDCGSNLGLEIIRGTVQDGDRFNYITHTRDGKILRSSSIYLRDSTGNMYALCVNLDITEFVRFESHLHETNRYDLGEPGNEEVFAKNVGELLEHFIARGQELVGREASAMNKEEKLQFLEFLDKKGAFLISKSGRRICEVLGISKFTLYNYLETIRNTENNAPGDDRSGKLDIAFEE